MTVTSTKQLVSPGQVAWADADDLRTAFTLAMSAMYKTEVPLYRSLVHIVSDINSQTLQAADIDAKVLAMRYGDVIESSRLDIERHGAIRLGTPEELKTIRRVFGLIGLHPVGYYDLSAAGLPMHATCFRPKTSASLQKNPFRVFTSVLRPELIQSEKAKKLALELLSKRDIFSRELRDLLDTGDAQGGRLTPAQGTVFVAEAMKTFKWHDTAIASQQDYQELKSEHPILADIASFRSAHINHLTPRTVDINAAEKEMKAQGLNVKGRIEGPPSRACPILLRQTSFLAIEERIKFLAVGHSTDEELVSGSHRARFGEIEERGAAVTPAGRKLYDQLLREAMSVASSASSQPTPGELDQQLKMAFEKYPDNWDALRKDGLVYFAFRPTSQGLAANLAEGSHSLESLLGQSHIEARPITYEDFLPLSAAGIFQSNLGASSSAAGLPAVSDVAGIESALGVALNDSDELYRGIQTESVRQSALQLGLVIQI